MARKLFKNIEEKEKFRNNVMALMDKIKESEKEYKEHLESFKEHDQKVEELFGCDGHCDTCNEQDRAECMYNFRQVNIHLLRRLKEDDILFQEDHEKLGMILENLCQIVFGLLDEYEEEYQNDEGTVLKFNEPDIGKPKVELLEELEMYS